MNLIDSSNFKSWVAIMDSKTCLECKDLNGKIYYIDEEPYPIPPIHQRDRCRIKLLKAMYAGNATIRGVDGADWQLARCGELPGYYITRDEAKALGWVKSKKNLHKVAPGKMIFGGIYMNENGHLPKKPGRIWYEADINYISGKRNRQRVVFSDDGLIFVTYDHYETFYEII